MIQNITAQVMAKRRSLFRGVSAPLGSGAAERLNPGAVTGARALYREYFNVVVAQEHST